MKISLKDYPPLLILEIQPSVQLPIKKVQITGNLNKSSIELMLLEVTPSNIQQNVVSLTIRTLTSVT